MRVTCREGMERNFLFLGLLPMWRTDTSRNVKISKVIKLGETNQGNKRLSIFYCPSSRLPQRNYANKTATEISKDEVRDI